MNEIKQVDFSYSDENTGREILDFCDLMLNNKLKLNDGAYYMLQIIREQVSNQIKV